MGINGAGKTYLSRNMAFDFKIVHLSSAIIRKNINPKPLYSSKENQKIYNIAKDLIQEILSRGISVIYDCNASFKELRIKLRKIAKKCNANYLLLWIHTPEKVANRRVKKRKMIKSKKERKYQTIITPKIIKIYQNKKYEFPKKDENYVVVKGNIPYKKQRKLLLQHLNYVKFI